MIRDLLGSGEELGINLSYIEQPAPDGIAQAFILGDKFIGNSPVSLILGDNIFFGHHLSDGVEKAADLIEGANVFAYRAEDRRGTALWSLINQVRLSALQKNRKNRNPTGQ